ncbi:hypothetical protein ACH5RR_001555 [Cinchona calisaya]|uniref:Uncharacterized protein n=1 Tax=Cinchona calisaya TaxID=153742 RepID=A0ABD3B4Z3_9GENT
MGSGNNVKNHVEVEDKCRDKQVVQGIDKGKEKQVLEGTSKGKRKQVLEYTGKGQEMQLLESTSKDKRKFWRVLAKNGLEEEGGERRGKRCRSSWRGVGEEGERRVWYGKVRQGEEGWTGDSVRWSREKVGGEGVVIKRGVVEQGKGGRRKGGRRDGGGYRCSRVEGVVEGVPGGNGGAGGGDLRKWQL